MITHESLREQAARLPKAQRERYFTQRDVIRRRLQVSRKAMRAYSPVVSWDDPEFVALCAIKLAELVSEVQDAANRLASR